MLLLLNNLKQSILNELDDLDNDAQSDYEKISSRVIKNYIK